LTPFDPELLGSGQLPVAGPARVRAEVRGLIGRERHGLGVLLGLQALATVAGLVAPRVLGDLVGTVAHHRGSATTVVVAISVLAGALLVQAELTRVAAVRAAVLGERVLARLRDRLVAGVLCLPLGVVERAGTGDLLTRTTTDVELLARGVQRAVPEVLIALVQILLTIAALALTAPELTLVLLPSVPLLVAGARWYLSRAPAGYLAEQAAQSAVNSRLQETVAAGRTIEAFGLAPRRAAQIDDDIDRWLSLERYTLSLRSVFFPITEAAYLVPVVLAVAVGGYLHAVGALSLAAVTAGVLYTQQLINPLDLLLGWMDELQLSATALARLLGVDEVRAQPVTDAVPVDEQILAEQVRFSYRDDHEVLRGFDTVLGSGGVSLSPAQSQQLALARLVLADPHTLVLDEATSLLDSGAARHLERSLARVLEGRTVVAVAHRLQSARDADCIAVVDGGRVLELGSHSQLLAAGGAYAGLWRAFSEQG
jgi:ABC-type multidrug transport system fused ATPase/permease subunit